MSRPIVTSYSPTILPYRTHDWTAWFDDEGEEAGNYGYGETEEAAIRDLRDNYGDDA